MIAQPRWTRTNLRKHFRKHGHKLACFSEDDYVSSSIVTIRQGVRFTYDDPDSLEPRVGYYEQPANLLTVVTASELKVVTHFPPDRGEQYCRDLPSSTYN